MEFVLRTELVGVFDGDYGVVEDLRMVVREGMDGRLICDARSPSASHSELSPTLEYSHPRPLTPSDPIPLLSSSLTRTTLSASHQEDSLLGISPK